ncbi:O-antigen ligase family protein [Klebsiella quasipneumoniae]|uniref:O-antigen ligase family protein n=1 Tax=Klebsiella quasipneumoniae TaxID=1463165 RepID=UPI001158E167|nr:O-antigen ligase family protein [Klebsiella quasipneumoniae]
MSKNNIISLIKFADGLLFLSLFLMCIGVKFYIVISFLFLASIISSGDKKKIDSLCFTILKVIYPVFLFLLIFSLISIIQGNDENFIFYESRDIIIATLIPAVLLSISTNNQSVNRIIKTFENMMVFIAGIKIFIILYCAIKGIPVFTAISAISSFMGWTLQSYTTDNDLLARIQFPIDCAIPFVLYYSVTNMLKLKNRRMLDFIKIILIMFSLFLSMSRGFWLMGIMMMSLSFIVNAPAKKIAVYFSICMVIIIIIYLSFSSYIDVIVSSRFDESANYTSDITRQIQRQHINAAIESAPLFGHGLGYYIPDFRRAYGVSSYTYELQSLSVFMKVGLVGSFCLFGIIFYIMAVFDYNYSENTVKKIFVKLVMFLAWVLTGSVNPLLFSLTGAAIIYLASISNYFTGVDKKHQNIDI